MTTSPRTGSSYPQDDAAYLSPTPDGFTSSAATGQPIPDTTPASAQNEADGDASISLSDSIGAWRDRASHAKTIKDHKRSREELAAKIRDAESQLEDNRYILENYGKEMAEQQAIVNKANDNLQREQSKLSDLQKQIAKTQSDLDAMIREHRQVSKGYGDSKDSTQKTLDETKKVASGLSNQVAKTQKAISNFEKEIASLSVTADTAKDESTIETARRNIQKLDAELSQAHDSLRDLQGQLAHANTDKAAAEAAAEGAAKAYKQITNTHEEEEKKVRRAIKDLEKKVEETQDSIAQTSARLEAAQARIAYVQDVNANPQATQQLANDIEASKQQAALMDKDLEQMEDVQEGLKQRSGKAVKTVVALGIAVVILIVIILIFVAMP